MEKKEKNTLSEKNYELADIEAHRTGEAEMPSEALEKPEAGKALENLEAVAESFRRARPGPGEIPESADRAVLENIRKRADEIRRERKIIRIPPRPFMAAAAVVLICFGLWEFFSAGPEFSKTPGGMFAKRERTAVSGDVDGDGAVDIIDAYLLAKRVENHNGWDVNGDGLADGGDVRTVALEAVSLGSEET